MTGLGRFDASDQCVDATRCSDRDYGNVMLRDGVEPIQAQNQAPPPEGFRIIGNIYCLGGEYGSYLITTPQGHILHDTGTNEMHDAIVSNVKKCGGSTSRTSK